MTWIRIAAIGLTALLLSAQATKEDDLDSTFGKDSLVISADRDACWFFEMYIAGNRSQQMRGLMFVRDLPEFTGMIFVYREAAIHSMWMKNTYIPLDMLFVKGDGAVSSVASNTTPLSLESISSTEPVNFVIELNAGVAERLAIGEQSRIIFTNLD